MSDGIAPGVGRILAEAREAKGLKVSEVAEKLKLTSRQIEALESEDFSRLPAAVFVRGFIRNYARLLDVPSEGLLEEIKEATVPTETITAPSEGLQLGSSPVKRWLVFPLLAFALFLILVALLYTWLSRGEEAYLPTEPVAPIIQPLPPPATPEPIAPAPVTPEPPTAAPAVTPPVAVPVPVAPAAPLPTPQTMAPPPPPSLALPIQEGPAGKAAGGPAILFQADEDAWIEVVSGDNRRFARLLRNGEQLTLRGTPPFRLVVGNAARVRMSYNDKAIDLRPYIGDRVARLTLE